ncbi:metal ABC transporter solute-binding protein, Zn/Mn family [Virgibacillus kimchii]
MKILKLIFFIMAAGFIIAGCTQSNQASTTNNDDEELTIYTTIYPIQYAAERIGGEKVMVESVLPPGVDAHTYEPATKDMTKIADGDAFFYLGAGMEAFAETAASALASQDTALIELGQHEELFHTENRTDQHHEDHEHEDEHHGHDHGDHDPHIWIDPLKMLDMATIIKDEMISLYPEQEDLFKENYAVLKEDLQELHEAFASILDEKENKRILVSHAAFGYWENRYGMEQISIHGISTSNEPSQKELTEIINTAEEHHMEYIIFEQNVSTRVAEIIQEQIGAETLVIHNLSVLTDEDIEANEDYLTLMEKNLKVLDQATN